MLMLLERKAACRLKLIQQVVVLHDECCLLLVRNVSAGLNYLVSNDLPPSPWRVHRKSESVPPATSKRRAGTLVLSTHHCGSAFSGKSSGFLTRMLNSCCSCILHSIPVPQVDNTHYGGKLCGLEINEMEKDEDWMLTFWGILTLGFLVESSLSPG